MLKKRDGFTLIELLIVIVIIGILAAIAIPKFGKTREKAYFKAMQSDLRNLQSQQEVYYSNPTNSYQYAPAVSNLTDFNPSQGVTVSMSGSGSTSTSSPASTTTRPAWTAAPGGRRAAATTSARCASPRPSSSARSPTRWPPAAMAMPR